MSQLIVNPTKDCHIEKDAPTTPGNSNVVWYGVPAKSTDLYRGLLHFDISSIPNGSTILSTSSLAVVIGTSVGSPPSTIKRITQTAWTEGATWNKYDGTTNWGVAGGDLSTPDVPFTPTGTGAFSITGAALAAFLQDALDNRSKSVNMAVKTDDEVSTGFQEWDSSEGATPPVLTVDYTTPTGFHRMMFGG